MKWIVQTTDGITAYDWQKNGAPSEEIAERDAADRNKRAEELDLKVRYEAVQR